MSEKIGMLPFSAIVKIEVNGAFLTRVKSLLFYVLKDKTQDELTTAGEKIKNQTHNEHWEFHYETLAILINDIEKAGSESGLTEYKTIEEIEEDAKNLGN